MTAVGKAFSIARVNLLRQVRERSNLFFVFALPLIIIFALGLQFSGGGLARIGILAPADDALAADLVAEIETAGGGFEIRRPEDAAALREQVERGMIEIGLVIPDGYGTALRSGQTARIEILGTPESVTAGLRAPIDAAIARQSAVVLAARVAADQSGVALGVALDAAIAAHPNAPGVSATVTTVGEAGPFAGFGQFSFGAQTQLVLFTFLTSMTAASSLVLTKNLGLSRRMLSTPTSAGTIVAGEALGRIGVALMQAIFIIVVTAAAFGVAWGDALAIAAIAATFGFVGAAVAMLFGAISRNPAQAGALGVVAGIGLGAVGGAMVPASFMPSFMLTIAHLTPHFWAIDALGQLARGADLATVAPNIAVLFAYGVVLMAFASWRFRRAITG